MKRSLKGARRLRAKFCLELAEEIIEEFCPLDTDPDAVAQVIDLALPLAHAEALQDVEDFKDDEDNRPSRKPGPAMEAIRRIQKALRLTPDIGLGGTLKSAAEFIERHVKPFKKHPVDQFIKGRA